MIMSTKYVAVSSDTQSMFRWGKDIIGIFGRYGDIKTYMPNWDHGECLIVFERTIDAQHCLEDSKRLLDEYNAIVEKARIPDNYMDIHEFEADRGIDNPDLPSLMNLNDDCLLHLLQFLPEELSLGDVSMRMRRLCKRKEKINHLKFGRPNLIFHYGPLLTHVSVNLNPELDDLTDFLNLISLRCINMTFLCVSVSTYTVFLSDENWPPLLRDIVPSLKELVFDVDVDTCSGSMGPDFDDPDFEDPDFDEIIPILEAVNGGKMKKLRINLTSDVPVPFHVLDFTPMAALSVLIIPNFIIDIGRVLGQLPALRVLACALVPSEEYPKNHELRDFYGFFDDEMEWFVGDAPNPLEEWKRALLSLSKTCPKLRNLRLRGNVCDLEDITNFFPELEGLYLDDCIEKYDDGTFEKMKKADLKTFIHTHRSEEVILDFSKLFSHFRKLEVLFWDKRVHGDIDDMLNNRPDNCTSLTVITEDQPTEEEKKTKYPKVQWARYLEEFFGPFSIFNVPSVVGLYGDSILKVKK